MPELSFTPHQQEAITAKPGNLLISAAAGSGKTAVLTERVVRMLTGENPVPADRLVIVTFTVAAAEEMRRRIGDRLSALLAADPGNALLVRQQLALPGARISTIHALCSGLVRDHFQKLGLSPECRIAEEGQISALEQEAAAETLEAAYATDDPGFLRLAAGTVTKDDRRLTELLLSLYRYTRSFAFPDRFLDEAAAMYRTADDPARHPWIRLITAHIRDGVAHCIALTEQSLAMLAEDPEVSTKYGPAFQADRAALQTADTLLAEDDPAPAFSFLRQIGRSRLSPLRNPTDPALIERLKEQRNAVFDLLKELSGRYLSFTPEELTQDMALLTPQVDALFELVRDLQRRLQAKKQTANWMDFNDLEHYALALLAEETPDGLRRTPLCESLSAEISEIMVDECQDINQIQDTLFSFLSREQTNLFMVGDVKQSIYRFRQAMPTLFVERKKAFPVYDAARYTEGDAAVITLDANFRCRSEICGFVNYIFSALMSEKIGEIAYGPQEYLAVGRTDIGPDEAAVPPSLYLLDASPDDPRSRVEIEAAFVADRIREMVAEGFPVHDKGDVRPCRYGDFAILFRSKKNTLSAFSQVLREKGVPCFAERTESCLASYEAGLALNLLRVIDNPLSDVPLLSVLASPLWGFSPTKLSEIRLADRKLPLYRALLQRAAEGDDDCTRFADTLGLFRQRAALLSVEQLLQEVCDRTDLFALSAAFGDPSRSRTNLRLLLRYAAGYGQFGSDLAGFLRYVDRLAEAGKDTAASGGSLPQEDQVQLLSIHASKGLEFPICFLADCSHLFNKKDLNAAFYQVHPALGFATKIMLPDTLQCYATLPYEAIRLKKEQEMLSEELRILYVALTRAKEKLCMVVTLSDLESRLPRLAQGATGGGLTPFQVYQGGSYAHWLVSACLSHPDAAELRRRLGLNGEAVLPASFPLSVSFHTAPVQQETEPEAEAVTPAPVLSRADWCDVLSKRLAFLYPNEPLTGIPAKVSVTALAKQQRAAAPSLTRRPGFLLAHTVTPAERGTLLHRFMELADFAAAAQDLSGEIERLVTHAYFTAAEADCLNLSQIRQFLASPLYARLAAGEVRREYKFDFFLPASAIDPSLPSPFAEEPVFVQGIADCLLFEPEGITLIDYKTDAVTHPSQLRERYAGQLTLYRAAISAAFDVPVRQTLLYSLTLGTEIEL